MLDGSEWSSSRPGRFTSGENAPGIRVVGTFVGPRAGMEAVAKRKESCPCIFVFLIYEHQEQ